MTAAFGAFNFNIDVFHFCSFLEGFDGVDNVGINKRCCCAINYNMTFFGD